MLNAYNKFSNGVLSTENPETFLNLLFRISFFLGIYGLFIIYKVNSLIKNIEIPQSREFTRYTFIVDSRHFQTPLSWKLQNKIRLDEGPDVIVHISKYFV